MKVVTPETTDKTDDAEASASEDASPTYLSGTDNEDDNAKEASPSLKASNSDAALDKKATSSVDPSKAEVKANADKETSDDEGADDEDNTKADANKNASEQKSEGVSS